MHHAWVEFTSLNASVIKLCSHMREYGRLWSVYLSTIIPVNSVMFTYLFYSVLMVHSNIWFFTLIYNLMCVYLLVVLFSLTGACALVDKKNHAVVRRNRVLYVQFQKSFPMPPHYSLKVMQ